MPNFRLLALLVCLSTGAHAQTAPRPMPPPTPRPRPPVVMPMDRVLVPTVPTVPTTRRRILPMPGQPGRFIICPGHRRCPPAR